VFGPLKGHLQDAVEGSVVFTDHYNITARLKVAWEKVNLLTYD